MNNKKYYSSKEIRELLNTTTSNLKYIEDALEFEIMRDENNKRMYSANDLECFKQTIKLRKRGYNYKEIKEQFQQSTKQEKEIAIDKNELDTKEMIREVVHEEMELFKHEILEEFKSIINQNSKDIENQINSISENFNNKISEVIDEEQKGKGLFSNIFKK